MSSRKDVTTSAYVQALLARRSDLELTFARPGRAGKVHVLIPVDPDVPPEFEPIDSMDDFSIIDWVLGKRSALCGWTARIYLSGVEGGDEVVDTFDDRLLCERCHSALGPHANRAFDHPQPGDAPADGEDDDSTTWDFHRRPSPT